MKKILCKVPLELSFLYAKGSLSQMLFKPTALLCKGHFLFELHLVQCVFYAKGFLCKLIFL